MVSIAILGFGIVGSGVAGVLTKNRELVDAAAGDAVRLKYIVDVRDFPDSPFAPLLTKDFSVVERDPDVRVVVETIGGCGVALEFTRRAILAGKHVVTSNKALVAAHGRELLELAKLHNVNYFFEASVGGGIPVLRPLKFDLAGNRITCIRGILNGTTNYILTAMREEKLSLEEALRSAQSKGYAEANPTDDLNGMDAARKLAILSDLAWGREVRAEEISREGIQNVSLKDVECAARLGGKLKLICEAKLLPEGGMTAFVAPQVVMPDSMLYAVDEAFNAVLITGNAVGDVMFYGTGAGSEPTASAVVGDVLDAVRHMGKRRDISWSGDPAALSDPMAVSGRWYVRRGDVAAIAEERPAGPMGEDAACYRVLEK